MLGELTNHLWQSTLFAGVAGVLTLAFRRNRAAVRYWLWFSASLKFFVPFSLLMSFGAHLEWPPSARIIATRLAPPAVSTTITQFSEPFRGPLRAAPPSIGEWIPVALFALWACGFTAIAMVRLRDWRRIRRAVRSSIAFDASVPVQVRSSRGLLEPGVVGWWRPILLLPDGIVQRLTPAQLEAILAHELCHIRRRDNLFAAIHMIVETTFWFHPLVWWIGARLVAERERACDEEVLRLGSEPGIYAEGIVNVCKLYVESPLVCVSGVTGANLKKRIEAILMNRNLLQLNVAQKLALVAAALAALAAPIAIGILHAPAVRAQSQTPGPPAAPTKPTPQPPGPATTATPPRLMMAPQILTQPPRALTSDDEYQRRLAYAREHFGSAANPMSHTYIKYGPPDLIFQSQNGLASSQIWRYKYLETFRSRAEFEFSLGTGPITMHINWPPPTATYDGVTNADATLVDALRKEKRDSGDAPNLNSIPGLSGARVQTYPAEESQVLTLPVGGMSGRVDILAQIKPQSAGGVADGAMLRDSVQASAETYQTSFTLKAGSYVCAYILREEATGKLLAGTINFDVQ